MKGISFPSLLLCNAGFAMLVFPLQAKSVIRTVHTNNETQHNTTQHSTQRTLGLRNGTFFLRDIQPPHPETIHVKRETTTAKKKGKRHSATLTRHAEFYFSCAGILVARPARHVARANANSATQKSTETALPFALSWNESTSETACISKRHTLLL